ncbi:MAG: CoA transferase, partial [Myxococcota bacterium]
MQVLSGIRVLDLTSGPVGGLATMVLADFGADVIKIERPSGDRFRSNPGAVFWLRGKRSVALDLHVPDDRDKLGRLIDRCDVIVVSSAEATLESLGIDWKTVSSRNPS